MLAISAILRKSLIFSIAKISCVPKDVISSSNAQ